MTRRCEIYEGNKEERTDVRVKILLRRGCRAISLYRFEEKENGRAEYNIFERETYPKLEEQAEEVVSLERSGRNRKQRERNLRRQEEPELDHARENCLKDEGKKLIQNIRRKRRWRSTMKPKTKVKRTRDEKVGEGSRAYDRSEREGGTWKEEKGIRKFATKRDGRRACQRERTGAGGRR